jgi:hypothetical protein
LTLLTKLIDGNQIIKLVIEKTISNIKAIATASQALNLSNQIYGRRRALVMASRSGGPAWRSEEEGQAMAEDGVA